MTNRLDRLESTFPHIASFCRNAPIAKTKEVAIAACQIALRAANAEHWAFGILEKAKANQKISAQEVKRIQSAATGFDDLYLNLWQSNDPDEKQRAMLHFSKARAVACLGFLAGMTLSEYEEAIYEAIMSFSNQAGVLRTIESEMTRQ